MQSPRCRQAAQRDQSPGTTDLGPFRKAGVLQTARSHHALANLRGAFAIRFTGHLAEFHLRHLDVQVNAVEQRAGNAPEVILDFAW